MREPLMLRRKGVTYSSEPMGDGRDSDWDEATLVRYEGQPEMRVGADYQAVIPEVCEPGEYRPLHKEGVLVWSPEDEVEVPKSKIDSFLQNATTKHGYSVEQALGMLLWHKYDVGKATDDLANFVPLPDDFTLEDRVLFKQGYNSHGKSFHRIKQMMPDKSMGSLIRFYYTWKKGKRGTSEVECHMKCKPRATEGVDTGKEDEDEKTEIKEGVQENFDSKRQVNWKTRQQSVRRGRRNLLSPPLRSSRNKRLPKGMLLSPAIVKEYTTNAGQKAMANLKSDLTDLKTKIQLAKQQPYNKPVKPISDLMTQRPTLPPKRGFSRWSNDEFQMAVEAVRRYGRNFQAMADIVGKTVQQCRNFFMNYRKRYNLDQVVEEYRSECQRRGTSGVSLTEDITKDDDKEVDDVTDEFTNEKHAVKCEKTPVSKQPHLELTTEDMEDDDREVMMAVKVESEVQPDSVGDEGMLPLDTAKETQSKSSKGGDASGRTADKTNSRSKKH